MPWDHAPVRRQRGLDFRLLRGGAVTADDRRSGDAGFAQSITDRRRVGRAADRAARRACRSTIFVAGNISPR